MSEASEVEITAEELTTLEDLEYAEATRKLLLDPSFHTFLVRWLTDTKHEGVAPIGAADLHILNWKMARASLMDEFMEGLAEIDSPQYLQLMQETLDYGRRRKRASDRAERRGANEPWRTPSSGDEY